MNNNFSWPETFAYVQLTPCKQHYQSPLHSDSPSLKSLFATFEETEGPLTTWAHRFTTLCFWEVLMLGLLQFLYVL
jgi:hypothetical protein